MAVERPPTCLGCDGSNCPTIPACAISYPNGRCKGHRKEINGGGQCRHRVGIGAKVCPSHGGAAPHVKRAAQARGERLRAERELAQMGESLGEVDPTEAILGLIGEAAGNIAFLRRKVQALQQHFVGRVYAAPGDASYVADVEVSDFGTGIVGTSHLGDGAAHIFVLLYGEWCDKLADYSTRAIRAGVAERQVRIAEQTGELIAQVLRGVLADLGVQGTPEVAAVVRKHLTLVAV